MKINKKTIALLSTLAFAANTHGMWPSLSVEAIKSAASSISEYASAARPAVSGVCQKAWSKINENKGYIGATAAAAGLVYGGYKAYQNYTQQKTLLVAVDASAQVSPDNQEESPVNSSAAVVDTPVAHAASSNEVETIPTAVITEVKQEKTEEAATSASNNEIAPASSQNDAQEASEDAEEAERKERLKQRMARLSLAGRAAIDRAAGNNMAGLASQVAQSAKKNK